MLNPSLVVHKIFKHLFPCPWSSVGCRLETIETRELIRGIQVGSCSSKRSNIGSDRASIDYLLTHQSPGISSGWARNGRRGRQHGASPTYLLPPQHPPHTWSTWRFPSTLSPRLYRTARPIGQTPGGEIERNNRSFIGRTAECPNTAWAVTTSPHCSYWLILLPIIQFVLFFFINFPLLVQFLF